MLKINKDKIFTYTEYNSDFIVASKLMGGKWNSDVKSWVFPIDIKDEVENLLHDFFGYGSEIIKKVKIKINDRYNYQNSGDQELIFFGRTIIRRPYKNSIIKTHNTVSIVKGGYPESGGSRNNPAIGEPEKSTEIIIRDVPKNLLHECPEYFDLEIISEEEKVSKYKNFETAELKEMLKEIQNELKNRG